MSVAKNKDIVSRYLMSVLPRGDLRAAAELVSGSALVHLPYVAYTLLVQRVFPTYRILIEDMTAEQDLVLVRSAVVASSRQGDASAPVAVSGPAFDLFRVSADRIAEHWQYWSLPSLPDVGMREAESEPVLDARDIQGNIVSGFNKDHQALLFLRITDVDRAKGWLHDLIPTIATVEEVESFNRLYRSVRGRRGRGTPTVRACWTNIAFTYQGLEQLTSDVDQFTDLAYREGMHARAPLLNDPTAQEADGHPANWIIGGPHNIPDIMLIVACDDATWLEDAIVQIESGLRGLALMHVDRGGTLPFPHTGHEHFGYKDGISQPGIRGRLSQDPTDFLSPRMNPVDASEGKPGQKLVWPGEFVFGYPRQNPDDPWAPGPDADAGPDWTRNGSFLVFRRLRQDVAGFLSYVRETAKLLAEQEPALHGVTPERLGAKLIGRWASGAPIVRAPGQDNEAMAADDCANNHFAYANASQPIPWIGPESCSDELIPQAPGDDLGLICPHAAHIRKVYPRDDPTPWGGAPDTETHRIIRRGIPYGDPYPADSERGLLFLAYQTSFTRQFEYISRNYSNNPDFRHAGDGYDPLIGQIGGQNGGRSFALPVRNVDGSITVTSLTLPPNWVIPTGGAYLFSPSIAGLHHLASTTKAGS